MPLHDDHLRQAEHNLQFSETLSGADYPDWVATGLFYAALHYIDAFLATRGQHPGSHDIRDGFVARVQELRPLYNDYRFLKNSSRTARYYCPPVPFTGGYLRSLRDTHLEQIRVGLRPFIPIP